MSLLQQEYGTGNHPPGKERSVLLGSRRLSGFLRNNRKDKKTWRRYRKAALLRQSYAWMALPGLRTDSDILFS